MGESGAEGGGSDLSERLDAKMAVNRRMDDGKKGRKRGLEEE